MDFLLSIQSFLLGTAVPFIILLGLLIFVHELGHFLVAKYFGVRVEVFSLGFGKKILQFKRGHTTYCVALIPLGGYVKMFGDDPSAEISESEKSESFTHKPVMQRIAVVLAGPLMNFFFAILLFAAIGIYGQREIGPQLGHISPTSQAWTDGFRTGDIIQSIDGSSPQTWQDIKNKIKSSPEQKLSFSVKRNNETLEISSTPKLITNPDVLDWEDKVGQVEGLSPLSFSSHVGVIKNSIVEKAGLQSLDQITEINGQEIKVWTDLEKYFLSSAAQVKTYDLKIQRLDEKKELQELQIKVALDAVLQKEPLQSLGIEKTDLYIFQAAKDTPAAQAGVQKGDKVLSLNGKEMKTWNDVLSTVSSYSGTGPIDFLFLRDGKEVQLPLIPKKNSFVGEQGQDVTRYQVGIQPAIFQTVATPIVFRTSGLVQSIAYGWNESLRWTKTTALSFVRMIQGKISKKNIGGIITIGQVASETFKLGLSPYLKIMAIISINLFILNLLPIPVLDGGHLIFLVLEALRGAPLSLKRMEALQQIGLLILMTLMAFALFNDITRIW